MNFFKKNKKDQEKQEELKTPEKDLRKIFEKHCRILEHLEKSNAEFKKVKDLIQHRYDRTKRKPKIIRHGCLIDLLRECREEFEKVKANVEEDKGKLEAYYHSEILEKYGKKTERSPVQTDRV